MSIDCYYDSSQCQEIVDGIYVIAAFMAINIFLMFYFMFRSLSLELNSRHKAVLRVAIPELKESTEDKVVCVELDQIAKKLKLDK